MFLRDLYLLSQTTCFSCFQLLLKFLSCFVVAYQNVQEGGVGILNQCKGLDWLGPCYAFTFFEGSCPLPNLSYCSINTKAVSMGVRPYMMPCHCLAEK